MRDNIDNLSVFFRNHPILKTKGSGLNRFCEIPSPIDNKRTLFVISSNGRGWDHVSISMKGRCPNWVEMSFIKNLYFMESETVVQYHPKLESYVNRAKHCLHLWRNQNQEHELPPSYLVG